MNDMSMVIVPKSDQYNAEDFLAGPRTFVIEAVSISPGQEQPVSIKLSGEDRVWRPCKSMSRCLVAIWGPDAKAYIGRNITLYNDPKVKWGGLEVGGIRVSHMSHITEPRTISLTVTRANKKPFVVRPLVVEKPAAVAKGRPAARTAPPEDDPEDIKLADDLVEIFDATTDLANHQELLEANAPQFAWLKENALRLWTAKVEPAVNASEARHVVIDPADDPLMAATLEMVQHIAARNRETHPALIASGKYSRLVDELTKADRIDLMNRLRDANSAALAREAV